MTAMTSTPAHTAARSLTYAQWMSAAAEEHTRILRLLGGLTQDQWQAPTDCDGWSVRDIVAHLAGAAASTATIRELVRQAWLGRRLGKDGDLVDRMNQVQVSERSGHSPAQLTADLEAQVRRGIAARRRLPAPVRTLRLPFGPPLGTRPLGYLMGRIYTRDAWMHRIDLTRATGAPLALTAEHDGALVEDVVAEWAATHGTAYDLTLTGLAGGSWRSRGTPEADPIRMDAVEFARTMSGRSAGDGLLAHGVPF
jgi:uncharacterized protein (TIGR03083 family)